MASTTDVHPQALLHAGTSRCMPALQNAAGARPRMRSRSMRPSGTWSPAECPLPPDEAYPARSGGGGPPAAAARAHSRASSAPNGMAAGACRWLSRAMLTNTSACSSSMYASAPARAHLRTARAPMRCPLCSLAAQGEPGAALDIARSSRMRDCSKAAQWQARTRQPGVCKACAGKEHWPLKCPRRRDATVGAPGSHARCARAGAGAGARARRAGTHRLDDTTWPSSNMMRSGALSARRRAARSPAMKSRKGSTRSSYARAYLLSTSPPAPARSPPRAWGRVQV